MLATISDKKKPVITGGKIDYFEPIVLTATDYYPFGMTMPGRTLAIGSGVAGATVSGTTTVNGYTVPVDLSVTNRSSSQPTEYVASNRVVLEGEFQSLASDEFVAYIADGSYAGTGNQGGGGSSGSTELYMYGFNGKERDNSIGIDNYDFDARILSGPLGRWGSIDPLQAKYPGISPYAFVQNSPLMFKDPDGKDLIVTVTYIGMDGHTMVVKKTDKSYFEYKWESTLTGMGYGVKADRIINATIDLRKDAEHAVTSYLSERTNRQEISTGEYLSGKAEAVGDYFSGGHNRENNGVKYGFMVYGSNDKDNKWQDGLPKAANGSESLEMGRYLDFVGGFRESASLTDLSEQFVTKLGGVKGDMKQFKQVFDMFAQQSSNLIEAALKIKAAKENYDATHSTPKKVYSGYNKGDIIFDGTQNIKVESDSTGICCQVGKATDTIPGAKSQKN
ncbi:RHS repeat-associated core domain-containing protein [Pinibacter soli]|uniref:RHS repeat-associated core domain-containing protein n=1 Tax=Pinibacter soli TaxID=3044211 RepID=A0ABT6RK11_9BACT|nr:RHS repeat-associated core domain-containing protein [Pinibacter soli]MDI3322740.1 RHS repeat-associated core domain-containing protein [Pinibacter soli]